MKVTINIKYLITREVEIPDNEEGKALESLLANEANKILENLDYSDLEWPEIRIVDENGKELADW